jgi:hypothetical protein
MGLANYVPPSHEFVLRGGSIRVEGLSLEHVSLLIQHHLPDIEALIDLFVNANQIAEGDFRKVAAAVVAQAPGFAANAIALAANEPDQAKQAARIPLPVQIEILTKIGDLTFAEVGGLGKAMETIVPLLANNKAMLTKMQAKAG